MTYFIENQLEINKSRWCLTNTRLRNTERSMHYDTIYIYIYFKFDGTGVWSQDLMLAKQVFYHLSHSASPSTVYFLMMGSKHAYKCIGMITKKFRIVVNFVR
jgi:hypothetical protein